MMRSSIRRSTVHACIVWAGLQPGACTRSPAFHPLPPSDVAVAIQQAWDFDDPVASEIRLRELARRALRPDRAQFETQIARALGLQGRYTDAVAVLDALEPHLDSFPEVVRVRWLLERGRCLRSSGSVQASQPLFVEAWRRARVAAFDALAIDAAHMVALTVEGNDALAWNERALEIATSSTDPLAQRWRTSIYNNIAWTYHDAGDYDRALFAFQQALAESSDLRDPSVTRIAEWSVGRALRSLGRHPEALAIQRELERQASPPDGYVLEEIAENLLALGRTDEATPYFARAFALLSNDPALAANDPARLGRLRALGDAASEGNRE